MYLKKLELYGFKTFAEKTEIEFTPGITCIVGPNGSGKSNIADAVRWVLGEQSVKSLRSSSLEEVIFAGSEKRKPLNMAQISLTVDNSDGRLPLEYTEINIVRRVFRDGESEYFINKVPSRLKDIQELFFDTGLGRNAYSLVNQGEVDFILTSKPEERRLILEEAAGVSKFKHKKKEALKKLENTKLNLVRLEDIIREINNQLLPLKEQADKAKKYQEAISRLQTLEINLKGTQLIQQKEKIESLYKEKSLIKERQDKKKQEIEKLTSLRSQNIKEIENLRNSLLFLQENCAQFDKILEEERTKIALKREKINSFNQQREIKLAIFKEIEKKIDNLNNEIENKIKELEIVKNSLQIKEKNIEENSQKIKLVSEEIDIKEKEISENNTQLFEIMRQIARNNNEISYFKNIRRDREKIINKLHTEKEILLKKVKKITEDIEKINLKIREEKNKFENLKNQKEDIENKKKEKIDEKEKIEKEIEKCKIKLASFKNLSQLLEEYSKAQPVKIILENKENFSGLLGEVSSIFKFNPELNKVLRLASGEIFHYLVVEDLSSAKKIIDYIKEGNLGKVGIIILDTLPEKNEFENSSAENILLNKIEYSENLKKLAEFLFGDVSVVENLSLEEVSKNSGKFVSSTGDLFYSNGVLISSSEEEYLATATLFKEMEEINIKNENLTKNLEKIKNELQKIFQEEEEIENKMKESEISLANFEKDYLFLQENSKEIEEELSILDKEIAELEQELFQMENKADIFQKNLTELNNKKEYLEKMLQNQQKFYEEKIREREDLINLNTSLKIEYASLKEKKENLENIVKNSEEEIQNLKQQTLTGIKEDRDFQEMIDNLEKSLQKDLLNLERLQAEREIKEKEIKNILEKINLLEGEIKKVEEEIEKLNREYSEIVDQVHSIQINITQLETETQEITTRLSEEYNISPEEVLIRCEKVEDQENSLKEIKKLKNFINSLGSVNLLAIEEYEKQKERFEFLNTQKEDLEKARVELLKFIKEIDNRTKKALLKTFEEIQKNFDSIFKQLFEGGEARLILLDESNILETGIDIEVRLPGKRVQNISLLSGGEKSLVAIALLFAILKVRPSPFCILDEIDAALDEINVEKFKKLLMEFSKDIQFIIITHNKGTMETADSLYGVTMEEEGISKLVSVRLQDVVNNG